MKEHERLRKKLEELSEGDLEKNAYEYRKTVNAYVEACNADKNAKGYNFSGLIFPAIIFERLEFEKHIDFTSVTFLGHVYFWEVTFSSDVDFTGSTYKHNADFNKVTFSGSATFTGTAFKGDASFIETVFTEDASFREATFTGSADFSRVRFLEEASFSGTEFSGRADLRDTKFSASASFGSAKFLGNANFNSVEFLGSANFVGTRFSGRASFRTAKFTGNADFSGVRFLGNADFSSAKFSGRASYGSARFSGRASFGSAKFLGSANFSYNVFSGSANFGGTKFKKKTYFNVAIFHDEVNFERASFTFLKQPPISAGKDEHKPISLEGAVLEAAHLWEIDTLTHYIFKEAFLLGVSLAGKSLKNCDFTGAVMKRVFTDGWQLDEATIKSTKYIYTDYKKEEQTDEDGNTKEVYVALEESRVPADGFFGKGSNAGFTIKEYFHRPYEWNYALDLPPELRLTAINAIQFFREYAENAKNEPLELETRKEGGKIRVTFQVESEEKRGRIEELFQEYVAKLLRLEGFVVEFENDGLTEEEKAEIQRKAVWAQQSLFIDLTRQAQLNASKTEDIVTNLLLPTLQKDREETMKYAVELVKATAQAGPQKVIQSLGANLVQETHVEQHVSVTNSTEITYKIIDMIDALDEVAGELGERKTEYMKKDLETAIEEIRGGKGAMAKGRLEAIWRTLREITDFASKFPKLFELSGIIEKMVL